MMKGKRFDCIKMKDQGQRQRAEALGGISSEERREFYRRAHEDLVRRKADLVARLRREAGGGGPQRG